MGKEVIVDEKDLELEEEEELDSNEDLDDDEEFEDSNPEDEEEEKTKEQEGEKKQSKTVNKYFKEQRLFEKNLETEKQKAYREGVVAAVGGVNPYTQEKIEDEADINKFLAMREMTEKGLDPIKDYHSYISNKEKETLKVKNAEIEQERFIREDAVKFSKEYPDVDMEKLLGDEQFVLFAGQALGKLPMSDIYDRFIKFTSSISQKSKQEAQQEAIKKFAREKAGSFGALGKKEASDKDGDIYSLEQIKKMSQQEVADNFEKVERSLAVHFKSK